MSRGTKLNRYKIFFVQTSTPIPRHAQKLSKGGKFCTQNNQFPTKSLVGSKNNSKYMPHIMGCFHTRMSPFGKVFASSFSTMESKKLVD